MLVLSDIEQQMLSRGLVSAKMIAAKLGRHPVSVRKDIAAHPEEFPSTRHGRRLHFYSTRAVAKFYGPMFQMVNFDDWRDVVEGSSHVARPSSIGGVPAAFEQQVPANSTRRKSRR